MEWTRVDPQNREKKKTQNRCANCGEKKNKKRDGDQAKRERKIQNSGRGREREGWKEEMKKVLFF